MLSALQTWIKKLPAYLDARVWLPFLYSWSFNPLKMALELLVIISFCHREVLTNNLKFDFSGIRRNSIRGVLYLSGATGKALGSTKKDGVSLEQWLQWIVVIRWLLNYELLVVVAKKTSLDLNSAKPAKNAGLAKLATKCIYLCTMFNTPLQRFLAGSSLHYVFHVVSAAQPNVSKIPLSCCDDAPEDDAPWNNWQG